MSWENSNDFRALDREEVSNFTLIILCSDLGARRSSTAQLQVRVQIVNDIFFSGSNTRLLWETRLGVGTTRALRGRRTVGPDWANWVSLHEASGCSPLPWAVAASEDQPHAWPGSWVWASHWRLWPETAVSIACLSATVVIKYMSLMLMTTGQFGTEPLDIFSFLSVTYKPNSCHPQSQWPCDFWAQWHRHTQLRRAPVNAFY